MIRTYLLFPMTLPWVIRQNMLRLVTPATVLLVALTTYRETLVEVLRPTARIDLEDRMRGGL